MSWRTESDCSHYILSVYRPSLLCLLCLRVILCITGTLYLKIQPNVFSGWKIFTWNCTLPLRDLCFLKSGDGSIKPGGYRGCQNPAFVVKWTGGRIDFPSPGSRLRDRSCELCSRQSRPASACLFFTSGAYTFTYGLQSSPCAFRCGFHHTSAPRAIDSVPSFSTSRKCVPTTLPPKVPRYRARSSQGSLISNGCCHLFR